MVSKQSMEYKILALSRKEEEKQWLQLTFSLMTAIAFSRFVCPAGEDWRKKEKWNSETGKREWFFEKKHCEMCLRWKLRRAREGGRERDDKKQEFLREWKAIPWNGAHKEILLSNCYQNFLRLVYPKKMLLVSIVLFVWNNTYISIEKWKWLGKSRQALPLQYNAEPFSLCCSSCPLSGKYKHWDATPRIWRWLCAASIRDSPYSLL